MARPGTGDAVAPNLPIAPPPVRALGAMIDIGVVLLGVAATAVLWAGTLRSVPGPSATAILIAFAALLQVGYPLACETVTRGRSLGKIAMGLRVVGDDGRPEGFRQALYRGLAGLVEIWALAGIPALACSLLTPRGKRLGDVLAGTVVISERRIIAPVAPPPFAMPPTLAWWASTLQLSTLHPATVDAARQFLWHAARLDPHTRQMTAYRISGEVLAQIFPPPPPGTPPELILAAVLAEWERRTGGGFGPGPT